MPDVFYCIYENQDEHAAKGHHYETKARERYVYLSSCMVRSVPLHSLPVCKLVCTMPMSTKDNSFIWRRSN